MQYYNVCKQSKPKIYNKYLFDLIYSFIMKYNVCKQSKPKKIQLVLVRHNILIMKYNFASEAS